MNSQDFATQEFSNSSQYYTAQVDVENTQVLAQHWGMLNIITSNKWIELIKDNVHIGRTFSHPNESDQYVILDKHDLPQYNVFQRVSSHHFTIQKLNNDESNDFPFGENQPAFIISKGQNGLIVDDEMLKKGEKKILKNNSLIKFPFYMHKTFQFKYWWSLNDPSITCSSILLKNYLVCGIIGRGSCGSVRLVIPLKKMPEEMKSKAVALKTIVYNTSTVYNSTALDTVKNEVDIMKKLSYRHVMSLLNHFTADDKYLYLLFDLMGGGDLLKRIVDSPDRRLSETDSKFFFLQLVKGVNYLHSNHVTHRDIKAENVFLSNRGISPLLRIGDFGLSKISDAMSTICGTLLYTAPEVFESSLYSQKVDIWSLGCLLYAMLSGKVPFADQGSGNEKLLEEKIKKAEYSLKGFNHVSLSSKNLINHMLQKNPALRLDTTQIFKHDWLIDQTNFERLMKTYQNHGFPENECREELLMVMQLQNLAITENRQKLYADNNLHYSDMQAAKRQRLQ
ncbi:hypothetical protein PVAND_002288 [Polypedilum vanderplanki]|uniref:Protein kinase domain-containing protein n=1 Tax=Polypedilum vanderplanki TaxID=319348 RepID=A0A9J6BRZ8_POLVA|nr:hypothetical protein PVAND_002288 [Polypedilum vanderplanki]